LLQTFAGLANSRQARLSPIDLGRQIQIRLIDLGIVGGLGTRQRRIDLCRKFNLRLLHALVAHYLVAAALALTLVPSMATVPILTRLISRASLTTCTKNPKAPSDGARKSQIVP
jgi:hypothetical protein